MRILMTGAAGALTCALALASPTTSSAHVPSECLGQARQAQGLVERYGDSLRTLDQVPTAELPAHLPEIFGAFNLSLDALDAASAVVACTMGEERMDEATTDPVSAPTTLEGILAFAERHEFALRIADRCADIFYQAIYGERSTSGPFLDVVTDWARAKQRGNEALAGPLHDLIVSRIEQAHEVLAEAQRRQITDDDRYAFSREYEEKCRAKVIRAMAGE